MSTRPKPAISIPEADFIRLPDAPFPEDMNNWSYFNSIGNGRSLTRHLGNEHSTLIISEAFIAPEPTSSQRGLMAPDLLVAFNVNPALSKERNGYVISDQGKPPDFVLEIGSRSTGRRDVTVKRDGYAHLGVLEYWRFDPSGGDYHGAPLAGDRLVDGVYQPIPIQQIDADTHQGYSPVLNLYLRWQHGSLAWHDPATGQRIPTLDDALDRADAERARADAEQIETARERARADAEQIETARERARADAERLETARERARADASEAARLEAEARVRELEAELERRQQP